MEENSSYSSYSLLLSRAIQKRKKKAWTRILRITGIVGIAVSGLFLLGMAVHFSAILGP